MRDEQDYWLDAMDVADNVARIRALRENIYATLVCSITRTPIFILGKPGCSKSLTVSLLISALTDPYVEQLVHLASFSVQPYQGSRQSTSSSLLQVFERALDRQRRNADEKLDEEFYLKMISAWKRSGHCKWLIALLK